MSTSYLQELIKNKGNRCFYTGIPCVTPKTNAKINEASTEHLITRARTFNGHIENDIVIAARGINNLVGCAPLKVKFTIKKELSLFVKTLPENIDDNTKIYLCMNKTKEILKSYKIFKIYPWGWKGIDDNKVKEKELMKREYMKLLTPEEKWVIFGGKDND